MRWFFTIILYSHTRHRQNTERKKTRKTAVSRARECKFNKNRKFYRILALRLSIKEAFSAFLSVRAQISRPRCAPEPHRRLTRARSGRAHVAILYLLPGLQYIRRCMQDARHPLSHESHEHEHAKTLRTPPEVCSTAALFTLQQLSRKCACVCALSPQASVRPATRRP